MFQQYLMILVQISVLVCFWILWQNIEQKLSRELFIWLTIYSPSSIEAKAIEEGIWRQEMNETMEVLTGLLTHNLLSPFY